jgi:hypothetical protein
LVGALQASFGGADALSGALGAGAAEASRTLTEQLPKELQQWASAVVGAAAGAMAGGGGSAGIQTGAATAWSGEVYNRQLHPKEQAAISALAKGDLEKERRLAIAACAVVRCSAGVSSSDPSYETLVQLEALGNNPLFAEERAQIALLATAHSDLFKYTWWDATTDFSSRNQIINRTFGGLQTIGGAAEVSAGVFLASSCATGLGCIGAGALMFHGLDQAVAGSKTFVSGSSQSTMGGAVLQSLGFSPDNAELVYGFSTLGTALPSITRTGTTIATEARILELGTASKRYDFLTKGIEVTPESLNTDIARLMRNEYLRGGVSASTTDQLVERALRSGTGIPVARLASRDEVFIRIVPSGLDPGVSSFYMSELQFRAIKDLPPNKIASLLGLPAQSAHGGVVQGFKAFEIRPKPGRIPIVFESTIAPAAQGPYSATGKLGQVIIPNLNEFTLPAARQ